MSPLSERAFIGIVAPGPQVPEERRRFQAITSSFDEPLLHVKPEGTGAHFLWIIYCNSEAHAVQLVREFSKDFSDAWLACGGIPDDRLFAPNGHSAGVRGVYRVTKGLSEEWKAGWMREDLSTVQLHSAG